MCIDNSAINKKKKLKDDIRNFSNMKIKDSLIGIQNIGKI